MLQRLLERPVCPYSGLAMAPGNAELDHDIPRSRAAEFPGVDVFSLNNLHWVHPKINQAKRDLTREEFIELCGQVVALCA